MGKEIFLVEELETRFAIEAVQYMHKVEELWETNKFEPTYFDAYITEPLYGEFIPEPYSKPLQSLCSKRNEVLRRKFCSENKTL